MLYQQKKPIGIQENLYQCAFIHFRETKRLGYRMFTLPKPKKLEKLRTHMKFYQIRQMSYKLKCTSQAPGPGDPSQSSFQLRVKL